MHTECAAIADTEYVPNDHMHSNANFKFHGNADAVLTAAATAAEQQ